MGLFSLDFIRLAVNFNPFYIYLLESPPSIFLFACQLVKMQFIIKYLRYNLLLNKKNTLTTAAKYIPVQSRCLNLCAQFVDVADLKE